MRMRMQVEALHEPGCSVFTLQGVRLQKHAKAWTPKHAARFMVPGRDSRIVEATHELDRATPSARSRIGNVTGKGKQLTTPPYGLSSGLPGS